MDGLFASFTMEPVSAACSLCFFPFPKRKEDQLAPFTARMQMIHDLFAQGPGLGSHDAYHSWPAASPSAFAFLLDVLLLRTVNRLRKRRGEAPNSAVEATKRTPTAENGLCTDGGDALILSRRFFARPDAIRAAEEGEARRENNGVRTLSTAANDDASYDNRRVVVSPLQNGEWAIGNAHSRILDGS
ncbi:hypothetical protein QR680_016449 [Steinernema hermaphroditum]|uniref:Uncharacterized protein n=1 Tax=Steinernema hermaphroditum TaxID=289476 RepID=A0AA39HBL4_9BILA|nr:hypothetical protein QR680_016449 [Steinernema hermaphroditum]